MNKNNIVTILLAIICIILVIFNLKMSYRLDIIEEKFEILNDKVDLLRR